MSDKRRNRFDKFKFVEELDSKQKFKKTKKNKKRFNERAEFESLEKLSDKNW